MLASGERAGVAVSGGADSVALLEALRELAPSLRLRLSVVHVQHGLRGEESDADERFVADLAARHGLNFHAGRADLGSRKHAGAENLEQAARRARYQYFSQLIAAGKADKIAVGHTLSDQAETVLFRLVRGSGGGGLAAIRPVREGVVRPLIEVSRDEVRRFLRSRGCSWREDSSNQDLSFARNRIRNRILPLLSAENPRLEETLARTAEWFLAEEDDWEQRIAGLSARLLEFDGGAVCFDADALGVHPLAVRRRLLRAAVRAARGDLAGVGFEHIEGLRALAESPEGAGSADLPGGWRAERSFRRVRLSRRDQPPARGYEIPVEAPGRIAVPGFASVIELRLCEAGRWDPPTRRYNRSRQDLVDWYKVPKPLRLREWRPGDRLHPPGRSKARKLKELFQQARVEAWRRLGWPVIAGPGACAGTGRYEGEGMIVWTRGFGVNAAFAPDNNSRVVLQIAERRPPADEDFENDLRRSRI